MCMAFICSLLWSVVCCMLLVTSLRGAPSVHKSSNAEGHTKEKRDHHGGIPMGNVAGCDDAETDIEVDWNPQSRNESTCAGDILKPDRTHFYCHCENKTLEPVHVCIPTSISYEDSLPTSGPHRPSWPVYGEYVYVPPQRWLHNLEHGAIVMLYHPCADPAEVRDLKQLVRGCLRKHIISPYPWLGEDVPLALLSWGCKLLMSRVLPDVAHTFIVNHANRGPEGNVAAGGKYKAGLLNTSDVVSDYHDTQLCPDFRLDSSAHAQNLSDPTLNPVQAASSDEALKPDRKYDKTLGDNRQETSHEERSALPQPVNPIAVQSKLRRHRLDEKTEKAQRSMDALNKAYRELMSES